MSVGGDGSLRGNALIDERDLIRAARELDAARADLREAHSILDVRARREAVATAVAKLALAARWIDQVVERRDQ